jgi:putative DNA primase/helicase
VLWGDAVEGPARELLATADAIGDDDVGGTLADAKRFLADLLADRPLPAKTIKADADGAGYSWATIRRAKKALGVEVRKSGGAFGGKGAVWKWYLPQGAQDATRCPTKKGEHLVGGLSILCEDPEARDLDEDIVEVEI